MRNFANYLDNGANTYLSSAELAAVAAIEGKLPNVAEYMKYAKTLDATAADTYRYLNFDQIHIYTDKADTIIPVELV
jgi:aconitate hydratase 2/2-methylisocitrate dehydratase